MESSNYIMLSGSGRSGTNITKKILNQHSGVYSMPFEYRFIIDPGGIIDFYNSFSASWSPYNADRKIRDLESFLLNLSKRKIGETIFAKIIAIVNKDGRKISPAKYHAWELDKWIPNYSKYVKELIESLVEFSYSAAWPGMDNYRTNYSLYFSKQMQKTELAPLLRRFILSCFGDLLQQNGKTHFVEDNTWNYLFAKEFSEILPKAKLIHIRRNPRDVIASIMKQRWCPSDIEQASIYYKSLMEHWMLVSKDIPINNIYECKFETLIENTEEELRKICEFVGLSFEKSVLEVDLGKANIGRWKEDMSPEEIEIVRRVLGDLVGRLGY
jgi:hypothetical protein